MEQKACILRVRHCKQQHCIMSTVSLPYHACRIKPKVPARTLLVRDLAVPCMARYAQWLRSQTTHLVRNIRAVNDLLAGSWSIRAIGFLAFIATMACMYVVHRCL